MKKSIVNAISLFVWLALRIRSCFVFGKSGFRVLLYHSVTDGIDKKEDKSEVNVPPELFKRQISFLEKHGYSFINLSQCYDIVSGKIECTKKAVLLTFDDGLRNILKEAIPFLKCRGISATIFVSGNFTKSGECYSWIERKEQLDPMRWVDLRGILDFFDVGSHSLSHTNMCLLNEDDIEKEVLRSKQLIEENTGKSVTSFSYPFGFIDAFDNRVKDALYRSGYKMAFCNIFGENKQRDDLFELKRMRVSAGDMPFRVLMKIEGAYDWVDKLKMLTIQYRTNKLSKNKGGY